MGPGFFYKKTLLARRFLPRQVLLALLLFFSIDSFFIWYSLLYQVHLYYYFLLRFLDDRRLRRWGLGYVGGRHDAGRGRNKILTSTTCKKILTKVFCYQNLLRKNRKKKTATKRPPYYFMNILSSN